MKWSLCLMIVFPLKYISWGSRIITQWWNMGFACSGFSLQHPKYLNSQIKILHQGLDASPVSELGQSGLTSHVFPFPALTGFVSWKSCSFFFNSPCLLQAGEQVWSLLFYLGWKQRFLNSIFLLKHCFPVLFLIGEIICIYRVQCDTWIHAYTLWNG